MSYKEASPNKGSRTNLKVNNSEQPSEATIFDLLSINRRRYVVDELADADRQPLDKFVDAIAQREASEKPEEGEDWQDIRRTVEVSLYQTHLPKLSNAGVVRYDWTEGWIQAGEHYERMLRYRRPADLESPGGLRSLFGR